MGRSLEPPGPFSAVFGPTRREPEKPSKTIEKSMIFASSGPLGKPLGGHLGRLGGLLDRLGAILGRLGGLFDRLGPNVGVLERSETVLEPFLTRRAPKQEGPSGFRKSRGALSIPWPPSSPPHSLLPFPCPEASAGPQGPSGDMIFRGGHLLPGRWLLLGTVRGQFSFHEAVPRRSVVTLL